MKNKLKYIKCHSFLLLLLMPVTGLLSAFSVNASPDTASPPSRVILFIIDGLHWDAPNRLPMDNLRECMRNGTAIRKTWLVMPHHPVTGPWNDLHTTSYPNPVLLAGTLFITPNTKYIQQAFKRRQNTAHVANSLAYRSLNRDYNYSMVKSTSDSAAVDFAINLMRTQQIHFMRLHLQDTGTAGWQCSRSKPGTPGYRNIWEDGSPYIKAALEADRQLGRLLDVLKAEDQMADTLLIITADHGQADTGWHPLLVEDSWCAPTILTGPGIRVGIELAEAEHTDIVPTICNIMEMDQPNTDQGSGRILHEIIISPPKNIMTPASDKPVIHAINQTIKDYIILRSEMLLKAVLNDPHLENTVILADRRFYGIEQFLDWHKAGNLINLLETNMKVLEQMRQALRESQP